MALSERDKENIRTIAKGVAKAIVPLSGMIPALEKAGDMPFDDRVSHIEKAILAFVEEVEGAI